MRKSVHADKAFGHEGTPVERTRPQSRSQARGFFFLPPLPFFFKRCSYNMIRRKTFDFHARRLILFPPLPREKPYAVMQRLRPKRHTSLIPCIYRSEKESENGRITRSFHRGTYLESLSFLFFFLTLSLLSRGHSRHARVGKIEFPKNARRQNWILINLLINNKKKGHRRN